jgi:hypothetical protein
MAALFLLNGITMLSAQNGQFAVRFTNCGFDCQNVKVTIAVQVKAHDAAHTFLMGDANYRFDYDPRIIKNPVIVSQENFSNQSPASDINYVAQNLNGSSAGATLGTVSLNTIYGGGGIGAKLVDTSWITVACIRFDVQDPNSCINLIWHDDTHFPITGMNEIVLLGNGSYDQYIVPAGGVFENYSVCIPSICSAVTAIDDINSTLKATSVSGSVASNDMSMGGTMSFNILSNVSNGTLTFLSDGSYTYLPSSSFVGTDVATYRVCNANGQCDTARLTITVLDVPTTTNNAPVANNDNPQTLMNTTLSGSVLGNDVDPNGNTLAVTTTPVTNVANGTLTLNSNGTFTYVPFTGFIGNDTFRYQVCDNGLPSLCDTAMVVIGVNPDANGTGNNAPFASDDAFYTYKNTVKSGDLKTNDNDPNGNTLTYNTTPVENPSHGTITINANGTFTYTPTTGFTGPDLFRYVVCDNGTPSLCDTATVYLTINPSPNVPPVVSETPQTVAEDSNSTLCVTVSDSNADDILSATVCGVTQGVVGTPSVVSGQLCFTYAPNLNYNGTDTVCIIVCDNGIPQMCDTARIPISVTPANDKPVVTPPTTTPTLPEDGTTTVCMPITDPDAGSSFTAVPCGALHGTVTATIAAEQACFTYTPQANYNGADTVCVVICDNGSPVLCDTVRIPISVTPVNDTPVVSETPVTGTEDMPLTICKTINDPDAGDTFTPIACGAVNGTLGTPSVVAGQVCVTYTPNSNYTGQDTVCIIVCDGAGACDTTHISVTVTPVADRPVVAIVPITTNEDTPTTVCMNITDPDAGSTFNATSCGASHGSVLTQITGNQVCVTYSPQTNYFGNDTLCVIVCDNANLCDTIRVPISVSSVNDKPVVADNSVNAPNNVTTTLCSSIVDPDIADNFTVTTCGNVSHGTANASVNNVTKELCVTYTPTTGYAGFDYACYIICDNGTPSKCDTFNVIFNVTPTNSAPIAINDIAMVTTTGTVSGNILMNDSDPENHILTVNATPFTGPNHGTIVLTPNGSYTYTPDGIFIGTDTIRYQVCDNGTPLLCTVGLLIIEVRPETMAGNQKPIANDDNTATPSGSPLTINVKANDFDPQGGTIGNPALIGTTVGGTTVVNPDGTVTFTPSPTFEGVATILYQICDNGMPVLCDTAALYIQVYPNPNMPNMAPVAVTDNATTTNTTQLSSNISLNDSDPNVGQTLAFSLITNVLNGNLTLLPTGVYTYTANSGYVGRDSFRYKICDDGTPSLCDTAWAFIDVTSPVVVAANLSPVASPDNPTVIAGTSTSINVKANDYEPNGQPMSNPTITTPSPNGTLSVNIDGKILFTPNSGFTGTTSFIYQICDTGTPALCDTALVTVTVAPAVSLVNRAPVAQDDIFSAAMNNSISNAVTSNDSDVDAGQTLIYTQLTLPTQGFLVSFNVNGTFNYTPLANFAGIDSFKYKVCDSASPSMCDTATVYLNLVNNPTNANLVPIATDDVASTTVGTSTTINVKSNDIDPNDTPLTNNPTIVGTPVGGTPTVNPDGTITFSPNTGFTGTASFVYSICDSGSPALCDMATVTVSVFNTTPFVNIAPIAQNDATTTLVNTPVNGNVASNDMDLNTGQVLTYTVSTNPTHGSVSLNANGTYIYTPQTGFEGIDSFRYQVCDNGTPISCSTAWAYIDITSIGININIAPVANDDSFMTLAGIPLTLPVKANDYDYNVEQTTSNPILIGTPVGGTVVINPDGAVTFTPNLGFTGQASFRYAICDNGSPMLCDTADVIIDVQPLPILSNTNLAPIGVDDANTTMKNTPVSGNVATNDTDPNGGQILTYILLQNPQHGTVSLNGNGTYNYTPTSNYVGTDRFVYVVCDNGIPTKCDTAQVVLIVFNDPCVALNLKVLLEGPYSTATGKMRTTLNTRGLLPGQTPIGQFAIPTPAGQPFTGAPWLYNGTETVSTYAPSVVDWVLVSVRVSNSSTASLLKTAALLHDDGRIEILSPCLTLPNGSYYIVIEHRNHLGVMSPTTVTVQNGVITYDFTTAESYVLNNPPSFGQKLLGGKWVMYAGDGKKNTQTTNFDINFNDSQLWKGESGIFDQYRYGDFNMDADVNFQDQVLWKSNNGKYSGVPH